MIVAGVNYFLVVREVSSFSRWERQVVSSLFLSGVSHFWGFAVSAEVHTIQDPNASMHTMVLDGTVDKSVSYTH